MEPTSNCEIESYGSILDKADAFVPLLWHAFAAVAIALAGLEGRNIVPSLPSQSTLLSVAPLFQAFLTGLPIVVIVKDDPKLSFGAWY
jgi:hypothetical protein